MRLVVSYLCGLVFGAGLVIGGMTQPAKVVGFLDIAGNWDPSLAMVMIGAIAAYAVAYRLITRLPAPAFAESFAIPQRSDIDAKLVGGAALFGIGWGLSGFCPGPAVTSLAAGSLAAPVFVVAMVTGMLIYAHVADYRAAAPSPGIESGRAAARPVESDA